MADNQEHNEVRASEVIEPERMSDEEMRETDPSARPNGKPHVHFQQIFIRQTPEGAEFSKIDSDHPEEPANPFNIIMPKPPAIATWICLFLSWFFLSSPLPFTVFIALPINLAALALALICLSRGGIGTGLLVLLLGTAGSLVVYLVGILRFLS